jgi:hypothetical protein
MPRKKKPSTPRRTRKPASPAFVVRGYIPQIRIPEGPARPFTPTYRETSISEIFDSLDTRPSVVIPDTGASHTLVLDEDEEEDLFGPGTHGIDRGDPSEDDFTDGAHDLIDQDVSDRRAHTIYSREEVSEYLDQLADGLDCDISELYDAYYGYSDD